MIQDKDVAPHLQRAGEHHRRTCRGGDIDAAMVAAYRAPLVAAPRAEGRDDRPLQGDLPEALPVALRRKPGGNGGDVPPLGVHDAWLEKGHLLLGDGHILYREAAAHHLKGSASFSHISTSAGGPHREAPWPRRSFGVNAHNRPISAVCGGGQRQGFALERGLYPSPVWRGHTDAGG